MPYKYAFTDLAAKEVDDAIGYIKTSLNAPIAASKLFGKMQDQIRLILDSPYSYPDCRAYFENDTNIRHCIVGNFMLVYKIDKKENSIVFLHFVYGRRNVQRILKNDVEGDGDEQDGCYET